MFIITYKIFKNQLDEKTTLLEINEIYDFYYETPLEITTDNWGYGYVEKEDVSIDLNIVFYGLKEDLDNFISEISEILCISQCAIKEESSDYETLNFPAIHIDENWVLASPEENFHGKNKINFISQGAFGTGLHETTQDILRYILNEDFRHKTVLDIGTGSGILSLAASIKGATKVTALDIRDVSEEVTFNASLNNLSNIEILVGNALNGEVTVDDYYDWIFINIGGEETQFFIDFINDHIKTNGNLLVSGLVEWSFDFVVGTVENKGYKLSDKYKNNEWCTAIFKKI